MTSSSVSPTQDVRQKKKLGRKQGIFVFSIVFLSMAAAMFVHKTGIGMPTTTVNKGTLLIEPQQLSDLGLRDSEGTELLASGKKWRLLIPYSNACDNACEANLFTSRQVHIRLGDKARRLERVLLAVDSLSPEKIKTLSEQHPRMRYVDVDRDTLNTWLSKTNAPKDLIGSASYFLADQNGFAMMFYNDKHHGNELLADIKKLLKFSYEE
jgi:cytochrome oxidase Cu insertion factor (SCO1/SenC/PrrC family)